ncbi:MAG: hypothetical protein LUF90_10400, partial [Rikenellaceae bacterium]|nr:hypothetical protein [Rikenellaceae bacterium]
MPERYFIRVIKYFVYLCLLFAVIYGLMLMMKQTSWNMIVSVTQNKNFWLLCAVFVILPLLYPFFGFVTRTVRARMDPGENRAIILRTAETNGFILVKELGNTMTFRPATMAGRLRTLFEDKVKIILKDDKIIITGPRK